MSRLQELIDLPAEQRRLGPFQLIEQLGSGGFAPVWLAREVHGSTDLRTAAVKLFGLDSTGSAQADAFRARVVAEARALCQVEHPCIVRFYALPSDDSGQILGLAMEYVNGTALDARVHGGATLAVGEVLRIGTMIASALSAVHRAGLVHRDVKPANVVESDGKYKLIDFGIAAAEIQRPPKARHLVDGFWVVPPGDSLSSEAPTLGGRDDDVRTRPPSAAEAGTWGYMAPECVTGRSRATSASDIYSLGVLLFQCLTGKLPVTFGRAPNDGPDYAILDGRAPSPSLLGAALAIPDALARLVDQMLAPAAGDRPRSAEWVAAELDRIRGGLADVKPTLQPEDIGPFRGLRRFEEDDRDVYFGRVGEIVTALDMLRTRGLVALVGPSGSGKSSLARAGVLPRVAEGALGGWPEEWDVAVAVADRDPRRSIAAALAALDPKVEGAAELSPAEVAERLADRASAARRGVLLLVDQLEELASAGAEARDWTIALLALVGERASPGVRALVTVRRDLLDPILESNRLGKVLLRGSLLVAPMDDAAWGNVIEQALSVYDYSFDGEAVREELARQLKIASGAMPLVQFALVELWRKRDRGRRKITLEGLASVGGIAGALDRHASATLAQIEREIPHGKRIAREVLIAMTSPQGTRLRRGVAEVAAAGHDAARVLAVLEQARLVVREADGVTLAHEAVLTQWGQLRDWIEDVRRDRLLAEDLEREAARRKADDTVPLPRGRRLYAWNELIRRASVNVSEAAREMVREGVWAARTRKMVPVLIAVLATVLVASLVWVHVQSLRQAKDEARQAQRDAEKRKEEAERNEEQARILAEELTDAQAEIERLAVELQKKPDPAKVKELEQQLTTARRVSAELKKKLEQQVTRPPAPDVGAPPPALSKTSPPPFPTVY